jgi:hypothetical protein
METQTSLPYMKQRKMFTGSSPEGSCWFEWRSAYVELAGRIAGRPVSVHQPSTARSLATRQLQGAVVIGE